MEAQMNLARRVADDYCCKNEGFRPLRLFHLVHKIFALLLLCPIVIRLSFILLKLLCLFTLSHTHLS